MVTPHELQKLKESAGEAVRRDIAQDDWMDECVPRLMNGNGQLDYLVAVNSCSAIWRAAVAEDQGAKS